MKYDYADDGNAASVTKELRAERDKVGRLRPHGTSNPPAEESWPPPDKRLVEDDRTPAPPLDDDALPFGWAAWIAEEAAARGCPKDYVAAALVAAASSWIGNARHVGATATWTEPPHLWFALIGSPSTGKTPAQRAVVEASRSLERDAEPGWEIEKSEHAGLVEGARVIEEDWRAALRKAVKDGVPPPQHPPGADAPLEPSRPRVMAMDATTEELQNILAGQPRGLLYVRDELSGWFGNHDRYGGHGGDRAFFLEAWNGGAYVADRVKYRGQPVRIPRAALAMLGGLQPDRLREALAGADDGLAARFCYVWPDPPPILRLATESDDSARDRRDRLAWAAKRLHDLQMDGNLAGEQAPRVLRLDGDAFKLFDELRCYAMKRARASRGLASGWHGKTGRALRLALIFELLAWALGAEEEPRSISGDAMVRAGGYLDYLAAMFDRVTGGLAIGRAEADAAMIARHILSTRPTALNAHALSASGLDVAARQRETCLRIPRSCGCGMDTAGGQEREWTAPRRLASVAATVGDRRMNRWRQRLAELSRDNPIPSLSCAPRDVQNVQNVQNAPPAPAIEHFEQIERRTETAPRLAAWRDRALLLLSGPCPYGVSPERWERACFGAKRFADAWAEKAMRLGWSFEELFALVEPFARLDLQGGLVSRRIDHCGSQRIRHNAAHCERGDAAHLSNVSGK